MFLRRSGGRQKLVVSLEMTCIIIFCGSEPPEDIVKKQVKLVLIKEWLHTYNWAVFMGYASDHIGLFCQVPVGIQLPPGQLLVACLESQEIGQQLFVREPIFDSCIDRNPTCMQIL